MAGYEDRAIINKEVTGFTWKHAAWFIGAVMMLEATFVGGFYSIKSDLERTKDDEAFDRTQIALLRVDVDVLKIQVAKLQTQQEAEINSKNQINK